MSQTIGQTSSIQATVSNGAAPARGESASLVALEPEGTLAPLGALFEQIDDRSQFGAELASYICSLLGARLGAIYQVPKPGSDGLVVGASDSEDGLVLAALSAAPPALPESEWSPALRKLAAESLRLGFGQRLSLSLEGEQHQVLAVPFAIAANENVCLSAILPPGRVAFTDPSFTILHLATQFLVQREVFVNAREKEGAFHQATLLVEMFSRSHHADTFRRAAFSLATELERFFECQRVAIGIGSPRQCKVAAVSGMSGDEARNLGTSHLAAAMRETMAVGKMTVWPRRDDLPEDAMVSANHDDLLQAFRAESVVVTPLVDKDDRPFGAWALIWSEKKSRPGDRDFALIRACKPHVSSLVEMLRRSKPGGISALWNRIWSSQGFLRRGITLAIPLLLAGALLVPVPYRIAAECRLQPVVRRTVAAPFENRLHRAFVKPGDLVTEGQLLAELEGREIRVRLAESVAARNAAAKKRDQAMVEAKPGEFQMAQFEADRLALEVERLEFQRDHLAIRSPVDGVVLTGNLERSEGVPVTTGQKLFEIAPLDTMLIEIYLRDSEIAHVAPGMPVHLRLESETGYRWETELQHLHPVSEIQESENVFVGEAVLPNRDDRLRPGMRGTARVISDRKPLGWIAFHRLWEYIQLKVW